MKFKDVLKHFGSRNKIAKALGITRQAVSKWAKEGVPPLQQFRLHDMTNGKLKKDCT